MKMQLGMIVTDARGKLGGQYVRKFRNTLVACNITQPTKSALRATNRAKRFMSQNASTWRRLSQAFKEDWIPIGLSIVKKDTFGNPKHLTAREAYMHVGYYSLLLYNTAPQATTYFSGSPSGLVNFIYIDMGTNQVVGSATSLVDVDFIILQAQLLDTVNSPITNSKYKTFYVNINLSTPEQLYSALHGEIAQPWKNKFMAIRATLVHSGGAVMQLDPSVVPITI